MKKLDGTLYTDPSALREIVDPESLWVPGNFYVTDALNFIDEKGLYNGEPLEDNQAYLLDNIGTHPLIHADQGGFMERKSSLYAVQGNVQTQGAAFANVVGNLEELRRLPYGPLVRLHSACAYSEVGQYITSRMYAHPTWFYEQADEFLPSFVPYGDGFVAGYPFHDDIEKSTDCDCRAQRMLAQFVIAAAGGIYISLAGDPHEGRGLGVKAKERIYREQERQERNRLDVDTVAACDTLGLPHDVRDYDHVIDFLKRLGLTKVMLLTNNPFKIGSLSKEFEVTPVSLIPTWLTTPARKYVLKKGDRLGHDLRERTQFNFEDGRLTLGKAPAYMDVPSIFSSSIRITHSYSIKNGIMTLHDNWPFI